MKCHILENLFVIYNLALISLNYFLLGVCYVYMKDFEKVD